MPASPIASHAPQPCQRWLRGRDRYLLDHPGERFNRSLYSVDLISESAAKQFVIEHHYSHSYPAACVRAGLFGRGGQLVGVAVFSQPMNQKVVPAHTGVPAQAGLELGRFVLLDDGAPANSETFFLGQAFKLLRTHRPHLRAIVSYSDPLPRYAADGSLVMPGHIGLIYKAHNAVPRGRGAARTLHMTRNGTVLSPRTLSKIRLGETGCDAAAKALVDLGAPRREFGESGSAWVDRVLSSGLVRPVRHPGNFIWTWSLDKRHTIQPLRAA